MAETLKYSFELESSKLHKNCKELQGPLLKISRKTHWQIINALGHLDHKKKERKNVISLTKHHIKLLRNQAGYEFNGPDSNCIGEESVRLPLPGLPYRLQQLLEDNPEQVYTVRDTDSDECFFVYAEVLDHLPNMCTYSESIPNEEKPYVLSKIGATEVITQDFSGLWFNNIKRKTQLSNDELRYIARYLVTFQAQEEEIPHDSSNCITYQNYLHRTILLERLVNAKVIINCDGFTTRRVVVLEDNTMFKITSKELKQFNTDNIPELTINYVPYDPFKRFSESAVNN